MSLSQSFLGRCSSNNLNFLLKIISNSVINVIQSAGLPLSLKGESLQVGFNGEGLALHIDFVQKSEKANFLKKSQELRSAMECNHENGHQRHREWGFTFFGGTSKTPWEEEDTSETAPKASDRESGVFVPFPLARSQVGDRVWIVEITDKQVKSRLLALRLTPGTALAIVSRTLGGSIIVAFQDKQIGLGAGMVNKILVTDAIGTDGRSVASINRVSTNSKVQPMNRDTNTYLCNLPVGCRGRIVGYEQVTGGYKGRLLAMGLTPGTEFTVISHGSVGDPIAIEVQGCKLILQKHEADVLCIEEVSHEEADNHLSGQSQLRQD